MMKMNHPVKLHLMEHGPSYVETVIGDFKYHLWLTVTGDGTPVPVSDRIVYKNPAISGQARRARTIKLQLDCGSGKAIGEHMLLEVPALYQAAKAALAAKMADEAEETRLRVIKARKIMKAEDLYDVMVACMMALGRGGANVDGGPNREEWVRAQVLMTYIQHGG